MGICFECRHTHSSLRLLLFLIFIVLLVVKATEAKSLSFDGDGVGRDGEAVPGENAPGAAAAQWPSSKLDQEGQGQLSSNVDIMNQDRMTSDTYPDDLPHTRMTRSARRSNGQRRGKRNSGHRSRHRERTMRRIAREETNNYFESLPRAQVYGLGQSANNSIENSTGVIRWQLTLPQSDNRVVNYTNVNFDTVGSGPNATVRGLVIREHGAYVIYSAVVVDGAPGRDGTRMYTRDCSQETTLSLPNQPDRVLMASYITPINASWAVIPSHFKLRDSSLQTGVFRLYPGDVVRVRIPHRQGYCSYANVNMDPTASYFGLYALNYRTTP